MKVSSIDRLEELLDTTRSGRGPCLKVLERMYRTRFLDEKLTKLVRMNKGATFHLESKGHELIGVVSGLSLTPEKDWGLPYYRDRAFAIGLGTPLHDLIGSFLGRDVPHHSGGRMMPEHFSHKRLRMPCQSSVVGSQFLQGVGVAMGVKLEGNNDVVYISAGDGATSQGDFHEALNFACIHKLSTVFVIQDNGWAISVPVRDQTAGGSIVHMARGYEGLTVHDIDGCDYEQVSKALAEAVSKGRAMEGPSLIVAQIPRLGAHSSSDDPKKYKDEATLQEELSRDPIPRYENWLLEKGLISNDEMQALKKTVLDEIDTASKKAESVPYAKEEHILDHVYCDVDIPEIVKETTNESVVIVDAINHALHEEMEKDEDVIVFGQDVAGGKGGVFGVTRHLTAKFGKERCFNTPLAESTIIGTAIGISMHGKKKAVVEVQFADYIWTGMNQLINELSSIHYRSNGEWNCPLVIRMPYGGYIQGGPYHSQSIEAYLTHCPGLKVVIPSNAADAKRLLKAAIRDPNPVIFLEHKALYRQRAFCAQPEPEADEIISFGKAKIIREGDDLTLVCYGMMAFMGYEVAENLAKEGIYVEVIDLRTVNPLDLDTILASVEKTGKLLVAHEAPLTSGFGAEISALIAEKAFDKLDAPIMRLGSLDCVVPYCKKLEDLVLPQKADLEQALRKLANY